MRRQCRICGLPFEGESWQRLCWPCWRAQKERTAEQAAYHRGFTDGLTAARSQQAVRPAVLDDAFLRDLLQLVHPDHQPSERAVVANRVTAALLTLRKQEVRDV